MPVLVGSASAAAAIRRVAVATVAEVRGLAAVALKARGWEETARGRGFEMAWPGSDEKVTIGKMITGFYTQAAGARTSDVERSSTKHLEWILKIAATRE